ncbi:MAG: hypothetical protein IH914_01620 [candidate division Zixibacteria bacterium]|nr:hypothetical protein [candidate division Zixibacteria bacterium]
MSQANIAGAAGLTALEKEKTFPGDNSPEWVCHHGMNAFVAAMEGNELKDWHISKSEWPNVREECRSQVVGFSEELQDSEGKSGWF